MNEIYNQPSEIIREGWFVISFMQVPAKNQNPYWKVGEG